MKEREEEKQKRNLREQLRQRAERLDSAYCRRADASIRRAVLALPEYAAAAMVFCYVGTAREIQTDPLIARMMADGKTVAVPLCTGKGLMEGRQIRSLTELQPGRYGIPEPPQTAPVIAPEGMDLIIVPCLSADRTGHRLGYGGGFYDRYLPQTSCPAVLLCREQMMVPGIPVEAHDVQLDQVISEEGVYHSSH